MGKADKDIEAKRKRSRTRLFNPHDGSSKPTIQVHEPKKLRKDKYKPKYQRDIPEELDWSGL